MSHRYESILIHSVFSTKDRKPIIPEQMKPKLWAYIGGIARTNEFKALAVGGMLDHVHALLSLPATLQISKAVQLIKGGSSKWLNDHLPRRSFSWQDSYGCLLDWDFADERHRSLYQHAGKAPREIQL